MLGAKHRVGIMGGTFDPIHYGHLFLAEEARVRCSLDHVVFIPNGQPAHAEGKQADADPATRWELVRLAVEANPYFQMSRIELERPGKSYSFDTVSELQRDYGPETELYFIAGADSIIDVGTWYRGEELLRLCTFVAASRPGFDLERAKGMLKPDLRDRVVWLEVPGLHIASRDLRRRVAEGEAIRYLTPDAVVEKIEELGLYRETDWREGERLALTSEASS